MPKLYSGKEVLRILKKKGFTVVSQKGSHIKLRGIRDEKLHTVIVPYHKQIAFGTFKSILSQASMSKREFESSL